MTLPKQLMERSYDPQTKSINNIKKLNQAIIEIINEEDFRLQYYNKFRDNPAKLREFKYDPNNPAFIPNANNTLPSGKSYNKFKNLNLPTGVVNIAPSAPAPVVNQPAPAPSVPSSSPGINMPPRFNNNPPLNQVHLPDAFMKKRRENKAISGIDQILNQTLNRNLPTR